MLLQGNRSIRASALLLACLLALLAACATPTTEPGRKTLADTDVAPGEVAIDEAAVAILRSAAEQIRNAPVFAVAAETGFDVVQSTGQKIEFGGRFVATIQRPDRARMTNQRRDGVRMEFVCDGNDMWMYSPDHDVYGRQPQPGDIDACFNCLIDELGVSTPLSTLFSSEFGASLDDGLVSCYLVGEALIDGRLCYHIAARNDYADYQVWVEKGDVPLLRRIVISYREEPGHPQYWAQFREWDFAVKPAPGTFIFQPPAGAERIRLAHVNDGEE